MRIHVDMPDHVYRQLVDAAEAHDVRVSDLIADTVWHLLGDPPRTTRVGRRTIVTPEIETRIRSLVALNRSYPEIAAALGIAVQTVTKAAKRMGLQSLRARRLETKGHAA